MLKARGISEHEALVAGAENAASSVHTLIYVLRLTVEPDLYLAAVRIDSGSSIGVSDILQDLAHRAKGIPIGSGWRMNCSADASQKISIGKAMAWP